MNDLISIIMPAYNAEKYIALAIDSVLAQTYSQWELIIINDGSTDKTLSIIEKYAEKDKRIQAITISNSKQAKARNIGIQAAKADWIAFLDADDLWLPEKLERQMQLLAADKDLDFLCSTGYIFNEPKIRDEKKIFGSIYGKWQGNQILPLLFESNKIAILSVIIRQKCLLKAGFFADRTPCEDYDMWLKIALQNANFYGMNEKLFRYRLHPTSSSNNRIQRVRVEIEIIKEVMPQVNLAQRIKEKRLDNLQRQLVKYLLKDGQQSEALKELEKIFWYNAFTRQAGNFLKRLIQIHPQLYRLFFEPVYQFSLWFR